MAVGGTWKIVLPAFLANLTVAVAKLAGWAVTGAASLLAEAVHSFADCGNQLLLLLGSARAARAATREHPFGYARERYFWAFVVAVVLFTLGSVYALVEGWEKLRHPHPMDSPGWALGILVFALVVEAAALAAAVRQARGFRREESWLAFVRRSKNPELAVILLEDFGAVTGVLLALLCVCLALLTGDPRWDAVGSLLIGLLLGVIALLIGSEMQSLLIGESASRVEERSILSAVEAHPSVRRVLHMRTQHLGPDELLVGVKVEFAGASSIAEVARAIDEIETELRARTAARVIYIEPDLRSEPAEDARGA